MAVRPPGDENDVVSRTEQQLGEPRNNPQEGIFLNLVDARAAEARARLLAHVGPPWLDNPLPGDERLDAGQRRALLEGRVRHLRDDGTQSWMPPMRLSMGQPARLHPDRRHEVCPFPYVVINFPQPGARRGGEAE